jgi:dTDP-glucose pyrophosphorylase
MTPTDGIIFTFNALHPKWSFVKVNSRGVVTELQEKNPISNIATCGIYWYRKGSEYVKYAEQMISKNIRVNDEFYVAPVYNEYILDNKTLIPFYVDKMFGIGTPEDLNSYLKTL